MGDAQQAPVILLDIDQELFIDTVRYGDVVEDATVATEVTSLDHVGDTYVLEGALLFTGSLRQPHSDGAEATVNRVEHRLPFLLRVPSKTQPRGIVNVASRISSWRLQVVGDNWIQMEADLQVSGLNGKQGFHFQCGSQEFGNLLFEGSPLRTSPTPVDERTDGEPPAPLDDTAEVLQTDEPTLEFIPHAMADAADTSYRNSFDAQQDLADYDRAMEGEPTMMRGSAEMEPSDPPSTSVDPAQLTPQVQSDDTVSNPEQPYSTFEFEHQVTPEETEPDPLPSTTHAPVELPFSAARSFSGGGFAPHEGFVEYPESAFRGEVIVSPAPEPPFSATTPESSSETDMMGMGEPAPVSPTLWSFVDFNQPERAYTLRYVVVMDDETIQTVAERLGCRPSDLMEANRLNGEEVYPGQTLRIPNSIGGLGVRS